MLQLKLVDIISGEQFLVLVRIQGGSTGKQNFGSFVIKVTNDLGASANMSYGNEFFWRKARIITGTSFKVKIDYWECPFHVQAFSANTIVKELLKYSHSVKIIINIIIN